MVAAHDDSAPIRCVADRSIVLRVRTAPVSRCETVTRTGNGCVLASGGGPRERATSRTCVDLCYARCGTGTLSKQ